MNIESLFFIVLLILIASTALIYIAREKYGKFRQELLDSQQRIIDNQLSITHELAESTKEIKKDIKQHINYTALKTSINLYRQIESKEEINKILPDSSLIGLRGWAFSPDALLVILKTILKNKPQVIVELGSGSSTIAIADLAKKYKLDTTLISVDHLEAYLDQTKSKVINSGYVEYTYAPIKAQKLPGIKKQVKWYDTKSILKQLNGRKIDLLIVDGPPEVTQKEARLPAFHALYSSLSDDGIVILDDYDRPDEQRAVQDWIEYAKDSHITVERVETEKGLALVSKRAK